MNAILLHIVSNLSDEDVDVNVIPKFQMPTTTFDYANASFVGVQLVDYLIVRCPKAISGEENSSLFVIIANMP